jgi:glycosyltransferase involved in cell wall biosynthesis
MRRRSVRQIAHTQGPLRIAMFAPSATLPAPPSHSVDRIIETLVKGLVELGHEVLVFAPKSSRTMGQLVPVGVAPILLREDPQCRRIRQAHRKALTEVLKRQSDIDVVHAHGLDISGILYSTHLLEDFSIPNLTTLHSAIDVTDYNYFSRCRNRIVACSKSQVDACPSMNVVDVIHHGLDPTGFPIVPGARDYLCFVGRMDAAKQPHVAIQLAIQCQMKIKLAGGVSNDRAQQYFSANVEPLLGHPAVEYLGEVGLEEKIDLISHARCNLHPTGFREPFGLSVIEAGFCGTPTLAIKRGALGEIIKHGETGILVEDFAEGCYRVHECINLDRRCVAEYTREMFNHIRMASGYVKAYEALLRGMR